MLIETGDVPEVHEADDSPVLHGEVPRVWVAVEGPFEEDLADHRLREAAGREDTIHIGLGQRYPIRKPNAFQHLHDEHAPSRHIPLYAGDLDMGVITNGSPQALGVAGFSQVVEFTAHEVTQVLDHLRDAVPPSCWDRLLQASGQGGDDVEVGLNGVFDSRAAYLDGDSPALVDGGVNLPDGGGSHALRIELIEDVL